MIVEDNTRMRRKAIKDISVGECFKLTDEPNTLYLRTSFTSIPGLNSEHIPCLKLMNGVIDILDEDRLVYPVKSRLIIGEDSYDKEVVRKRINDKIDGFIRQMDMDLCKYMFDENGNSTQLRWDIKEAAKEYKMRGEDANV